MSINGDLRADLLKAANEWICNGYHVLIRQICITQGTARPIACASVIFQPTPWNFHDFSVSTTDLYAEQRVRNNISKKAALNIIKKISSGHTGKFYLPASEIEYYIEPQTDEQWQRSFNARVSSRKEVITSDRLYALDNQLRASEVPFDGLQDLCRWLEFDKSIILGQNSTIDLRVAPPAIILFSPFCLAQGKLNISFHAHKNINPSRIHVGVAQFPGDPKTARINATSLLRWKLPTSELREASLSLDAPHADRALVMLSVGNRTAQRQWFGDPEKAVNKNFLAANFFDSELKVLRQFLLNTPSGESRKFEHAIVGLLFILGFASATQVEQNAPDIIATTPLGKIILVECTLKVQDFRNKLGKLFERKKSLSEALEKANQDAQIYAFLVCGCSRSQLVIEDQLLVEHRIGLLCKEDIEQALTTLNSPQNPDDLIVNYTKRVFGNSTV